MSIRNNEESPIRPITRPRSEAREAYDRISRVYDFLASSEKRYALECIELLSVEAGHRIVEIGSGTGDALLELARGVGPNGSVIGIDISPRMCEIARRKVDNHGLSGNVRVECRDALDLPFETESVDICLLSFTLELFSQDDMDSLLRECYRVLRKNGRIGVVALSRSSAGTAIRIYEWFHDKLPRLVDCRPIHAARTIQNAGFTLLCTRNRRMWGLPLDIITATKR